MITQEQIEKNQIILSKKILLECCKENNIYKAKASANEDMLLLNAGDKVKISHSGKTIVSCEMINKK